MQLISTRYQKNWSGDDTSNFRGQNLYTLITFAHLHMIGYFLHQIKKLIQGFKCIQFRN